MASTLWRRASREAVTPAASDARSNWWPRGASLVALCWLAGVGVLAVISALVSTTMGAAWPLTDNQWFYGPVERSGIAFNLGALALAVGVSVALGAFRPAWWRRALLALAALPVPVLLYTSHNVAAGLTVLALLLPAVWLGREVARGFLRETDPATAWIVGGGIGVGLIAMLGFGLGLVGLLRPGALWPLLAATALWLVATGRRRLREDVAAFGHWLRRPVGRAPLVWLLAAFVLTFFWLNLFGALAPDTATDAVRQRLPAAAHFAATGRLAADVPELAVAKDTAVGETTYAVALAAGPLQAADLLAFATSLLCTAAIFGLGRQLGGSQAGGIAAAAFYTMPIVAFLSHTAYLDLFTTLYAVAAALILLRHEHPDWRAAVAAGFCVGVGVGVTVRFGYVAVGLAVLLGLLALRRGGPLAVARLVALLAAAALLTVAAPLARSALLTGQVPGLALATASLTRGAGADPAIMGDLVRFGIGRSPADLARLPFALTFHTDAFEWPPTPWGPFGRLIGYLFFGLGPLLLVARPRPRALALCAGIAVATLLWFYTAQYLRYGLPILAMFLPVAGLAYVSVQQGIKGAAPRAALGVLVVVLAAAGGALQLRVPTYERDYVLGRQDRATYLSRYSFCCAGYTALHLVDQQPDVGGVFVVPDPGLLYTRARLSSPQTFVGDGPTSATDAATALARLDAGHVTYIVLGRWYFGRPPYFDAPSWDAAPLLTEEFLRRNTVLVGGGDGDNTYVYSLLPPDQRGKEQSWAQGHELLPNGELAAGPVGVPAGWVATGQPRYDAATHAVLATTNDYLSTTVPVTPNVQYLLSHVTRSAGGEAWARLRVTWRDRAGRVVGDTIEAAPASPRGDHTFSMLATAPAGAATATVYAQADSGEVWFADFSFRTVQPDGAAASGARRE